MRRVALIGLVLTGLLVAGAAGCGSLDKQALSARLLELPGNAPAAASLEHALLPLELGGKSREVEVTVLRMPRPGAPRLLLVHGTPGTLLNWTPVIHGDETFEGLATDFDVTALELAGHGMSRDGLEPESFQECADFVAAAADALGLAPSIVVGHSYGGEVAWRFALDRPDLVEALVLVDASGYTRADDAWLPEEQAMRDLPGAGFGWLLNARDRMATALEPHFRGEPPEDFAEEIFLVCENAVNWNTMVDLARDENGTRAEELPRLEMPTLLVWGDDDVAYPVEGFGRRFEADIRDAELVVIEDCGHYPPLERPAAFVKLLRSRFAR